MEEKLQETHPISQAQAGHLAALLTARSQAERELQQFMSYLYAEHDLRPDDGWTKVDAQLGFVRERVNEE